MGWSQTKLRRARPLLTRWKVGENRGRRGPFRQVGKYPPQGHSRALEHWLTPYAARVAHDPVAVVHDLPYSNAPSHRAPSVPRPDDFVPCSWHSPSGGQVQLRINPNTHEGQV